MKIEYKKYRYDIDIDELTQGQVESFFRKLREDYNTEKVSGVEYQGASVRVANDLGWIKPEIDVDNSSPSLVRLLSTKISEFIADSLEIDPK